MFLWVPVRVHEVVAELREALNGPPRFETMPPSIIPCNLCVSKLYLNGTSYFASLDYSGKHIVESVFESLVKLAETRVPDGLPSRWVPIPTHRLPLKVNHIPPSPFPLLVAFCSTGGKCMCKATVASPRRFLREASAWVSHVFNIEPQNEIQEYSLEEFLQGKVSKSGAYVFTLEAFRVLAKPFGGTIVRTPLTLNTKPVGGGRIVLGEVVDHLGYPTGSKYSVVVGQMHSLIVGTTGSGKSTSAARFALETSRAHVKTVVLDWTGEYPSMLSAKVLRPGSDFSLPLKTLSVRVVFEILKYHAETVWNTVLSPMQYSILRKAVYKAQGNPREIFYTVERELGSSRRDVRQASNALLNKLEPVRNVLHTLTSNTNPPLSLRNLPYLAIVNLGAYETSEEKALAAQLVLHSLIAQLRNVVSKKPILHVVLEEAHHYLKPHMELPTLIEEALIEHRKHGINLTLVTSNPNLPQTVTLNTQLILVHRANTLHVATKTGRTGFTSTPANTNIRKTHKTTTNRPSNSGITKPAATNTNPNKTTMETLINQPSTLQCMQVELIEQNSFSI